MSQSGDFSKGRNSGSPSPPLSSIKGGSLVFGAPGPQSNTAALEENAPDFGPLSRWWHLVPTLAPPLRSPPPPPRAEGRVGADPMSHVLGLELRREAPPLLGPLLSPFPLPLFPGAARCCAAITDSPSPVRLGKGPHGGSARHRRCRGERPGGSRSGKVPTRVRAGLQPGEASAGGA